MGCWNDGGEIDWETKDQRGDGIIMFSPANLEVGIFPSLSFLLFSHTLLASSLPLGLLHVSLCISLFLLLSL